jgi:phage-related minor tail protein
VLKGLEQDIARIIIRSAVTQPLGNAISGAVSAGIGGMFSGGGVTPVPTTGGVSQNPFGFADGGIMTPGGPLPLNRYANGGVADRPQLALFGEGDMNEAYVPLPDGRSIPVTMRGGRGMTFAPTYNIDARGADASMVPRLRAEMVAVARAANAELLAEIQRGGRAASIVGRR